MSGDITLSSAALAMVTAVVGALVSAIGILFWQLMAAKNAEITRSQDTTARLMAMLDRLIPAVEETSRQVQRLVTLIDSSRTGKPA